MATDSKKTDAEILIPGTNLRSRPARPMTADEMIDIANREVEYWMEAADKPFQPILPYDALVRLALENDSAAVDSSRLGPDGFGTEIADERDEAVLRGTLYAMLQRGDLIATGTRVSDLDSERFTINPEKWHFLRISFRTHEAYPESQSASRVRDPSVAAMFDADTEFVGYAYAYNLLIYRPAKADKARAAIESKANATNKCRAWIKAQAEVGEIWTKKNAWAAVRVECAGLSHRQFQHAWDAEAPTDWKRPGRKSKQSNRNAVSKRQKS